MKYVLVFISFFTIVNIYGQQLHDEISKVYNFQPHSMTSEEQQAVFPKLDDFFMFVKNDKDKYLEPLRTELRNDDNNPYFYFDGGVLLLEISKTKKDYQLVADALIKTDLRDLPADLYLNYLLNLSLKGADVINAALHILDDTTFVAYIPQHALTLKYATGLKFILPRYPSELYINKLIDRFNLTQSTELKITFLDLFIYANSCDADKVLLMSVLSKNQKIREATEEAYKWSRVSKKANRKAYLRNFSKRKKIMNRISDEAGYEIDNFTIKMRKSYECKEE